MNTSQLPYELQWVGPLGKEPTVSLVSVPPILLKPCFVLISLWGPAKKKTTRKIDPQAFLSACPTLQDVKKPGSKTVTVAARGVFREDDALQERFFRMLRM